MPLTSINIYTLKQVRTKRHRYDLESFQITRPSVCYNLLQYLLALRSEPAERFGIIASIRSSGFISSGTARLIEFISNPGKSL